MQLYLQAGKPILATESVAKAGFHLAPGVTFGDGLHSALRTQIDLAFADRYLHTISAAGRAAQERKLARARFEAPQPAVPNRSGPSILLETRSFHSGGLERVVLEMAQWLKDARYPVSVAVVAESGDMAKECNALGIGVAHVQGDATRLAALMDRDQPGLLIPHYSNLGAELAWRRGIPVLSILHNSYIWAGPDLEREIRRSDLFVSRYIAVSSSAKDFFSRRFGISPEKIGIIPNGIDVERCERALALPPVVTRAQLGIDPDDIVLLMVGSLIGTKAQMHAISALSRIARTRRNVKLIIIGPPYDAAYAELLHRTVANLRLEQEVRILPESDSIFDFYRLADALLCTSLTEGWSLAMTEAMFCGLPILTTGVGGAREAIEANRLGIVFPPAYEDILDLNDSNLWAYATQSAPSNLSAITAAIETFCKAPETWKSQAAAGPEIDRLLLEHYGEIHWQRP
jgi:glycosyltransferase involved in cell wall biosynthesis